MCILQSVTMVVISLKVQTLIQNFVILCCYLGIKVEECDASCTEMCIATSIAFG